MRLHLTVTVDTECDKGPHWLIRRPLSFINILYGVCDNLQPLFLEYNIKPTYLLSPEVLQDDRSVKIFKSFAENVELGTHLHSEFIEPLPKRDARRTADFQSDYAPHIEFEKIKNLTRLFIEKIGYQPKSFRCGRFGISRYTLMFLEKLGYLVDSSVTPYKWWWRRKGEGVNFLGSDVQPYYPSYKDFRRHGSMKILEAPVTCINTFWDYFPKGIQMTLNPLNRYQTILLNVFLGRYLNVKWLRPTYSTVDEMCEIVEKVSRKSNTEDVILCMMFHSNEATPCMNPYTKNGREVQKFLERIRLFLEKIQANHAVNSIGLSEVYNIVTSQ